MSRDCTMYNNNISLELTNVSFSGNRASISGGGMYNLSLSSSYFLHIILWNNGGGQIINSASSPTIAYSILEDCIDSGGFWVTQCGINSAGNLDTDPLFVTPIDPATAPTTAGDLHLQFGSPAVDAGYNDFCPPTDLDGYTRPIDGDLDGSADCDMGAYEKTIDLFLPLIMR